MDLLWICSLQAIEDNEVSVPYAGGAGDLHSITVIDTKGERQPSVVSLVSGAPGLVGNDVPLLRFAMIHATKYLSIALSDVKGKELGLSDLVEGGFSRNYPGTDIKVTFDGSSTVTNGQAQEVEAPSGTYTLTVKGLKPFGNPNPPADFDTWISAPIKVENKLITNLENYIKVEYLICKLSILILINNY
ncbi:hypothetical protein K7432_017411 [Basidiobolus ranarum]|uniref:Uncharacterized protein n=1 Tax=Basidiobolus ranarum TaxID=34480 RepID=A0ABR2WDE5_9FUNG